MLRTPPTTRLINSIFGEDYPLLERIYCGIDEVPFYRITGVLNFEDIASIAGGCRVLRERDLQRRRTGKSETFIPFVNELSLYDIAHRAQKIMSKRFPWFRSLKGTLSKTNYSKYCSINPFGKNLRERLDLIKGEDEKAIRDRLSGVVYTYMTESQYEKMNAMQQGGYPFRKVMNFLPFKKKGKSAKSLVSCFAKELAGRMDEWNFETLKEADEYLRKEYQS